jgi:hypothetical protein
MIRYKVTTKKRLSFVVDPDSSYCLIYPKNKTVKAPDNTLGIMVFDTLESAKHFCSGYGEYLILKVKPIGQAKKFDKISVAAWQGSLDKFYAGKPVRKMNPFPGTECYQSVKVLQ